MIVVTEILELESKKITGYICSAKHNNMTDKHINEKKKEKKKKKKGKTQQQQHNKSSVHENTAMKVAQGID